MKKKYLISILVFITVGLFFVPSFWFLPNQYHLGGDDSRVYLYQPLDWLVNIGFWPKVTVGVFSSNIPQHMYLPFVLFAGILQKLFFFANLQALLYGLCLSFGFLSMYFLIREVLEADDHKAFLAAIFGGLVYLFLPLSYITFFMNPVKYLFVIILFPSLLWLYIKAVHKKNIRYLFFGALLSALLSISFSDVPYVYAFSIGFGTFLVCTIIVEWQKRLLWIRYLLLYCLFIILCNFFWLFPFFASPFYGDNIISNAVGQQIRLENVAGINLGASKFNFIDTLLGLNSRILYEDVTFLKSIFSISFINVIFPVIILSGLLLSRIDTEKKKRYLTFLIPFIILSYLQTVNIGTWGPQLFSFLVNTVPGFVSLRNFDFKVAPTYMLFYSLTLSVAFYLLLTHYKKKYVTVVMSLILGAVLLFNAFPFLSGQVISLSLSQFQHIDRKVILSNDYLNFLKKVVPLWPESRVVTFPFTFGSWSIFLGEQGGAYIGHPITQILGGRDSIGGRVAFIDSQLPALGDTVTKAFMYEDYRAAQSLFGFLNIRSVVYHPSIFEKGIDPKFISSQLWNFSEGFTQDKYLQFLQTLVFDKSVSSQNQHVYYIPESDYLPRIFASNRTIQIQDMNALLDQLSLLRSIDPHAVLVERKRASKQIYPSEFSSAVVSEADCIGCLPQQQLQLSLPFIRFLPSSPFYKYIAWKEQRLEEQILATNDLQAIVQYELIFAGKRFHEFVQLTGNGSNLKDRSDVLDKFEKNIEKIFDAFASASNADKTKNDTRFYVDQYLSFYSNKLNEIFNNADKSDIFSELVKKHINSIEVKRKQLTNEIWISDDQMMRYILSVPRTGLYTVYLTHYDGAVNDMDIATSAGILTPEERNIAQKQDEVISLGKYYFNQGEMSLNINRWSGQNLIADNAQSFSIESGSSKNISISDYDWKKTYRISFDYQMIGKDDAQFQIIQNNDKHDNVDLPIRAVSKSLDGNEAKKTFSFVFKPNINSQTTSLHFLVSSQYENSLLTIQNIQVKQIISPKMIIVSNDTQNIHQPVPLITFKKINPILYQVEVENATNSYLLVLSDAFSKGWRVYLTHQQQDTSNEYKYNYLQGQVHEKTPENVLFDLQYLLLGKQIAADQHHNVNGYANAWHISPNEVGDKKDYTLMIFFWPQYIFYISTLITVLGIIIIAIYLWKFYKR